MSDMEKEVFESIEKLTKLQSEKDSIELLAIELQKAD